MDKKKLRNDIIFIGIAVAISLVTMLVFIFTKTNSNLIAYIYVSNVLKETINLEQAEDREFKVQGKNGDVTISIKDGAIAIIESSCPHKDCVNVGYVKETNRPIICASNEVYIVILSDVNYKEDIII